MSIDFNWFIYWSVLVIGSLAFKEKPQKYHRRGLPVTRGDLNKVIPAFAKTSSDLIFLTIASKNSQNFVTTFAGTNSGKTVPIVTAINSEKLCKNKFRENSSELYKRIFRAYSSHDCKASILCQVKRFINNFKQAKGNARKFFFPLPCLP